MSLPTTPSQTVGPFFHLGLDPLNQGNLAGLRGTGDVMTIQGRILDGDGEGVSDGLIEIWLADSQGHYSHPEDRGGTTGGEVFRGFGRISTGSSGFFRVAVPKPGPVAGSEGALQAPHVVVTVFARGLLKQLITRIYFPDEAANATDAILSRVPAERRSTLIARRVAGAENLLEWNIILQGDGETVFFDF